MTYNDNRPATVQECVQPDGNFTAAEMRAIADHMDKVKA